jgi:hypothetical protein
LNRPGFQNVAAAATPHAPENPEICWNRLSRVQLILFYQNPEYTKGFRHKQRFLRYKKGPSINR